MNAKTHAPLPLEESEATDPPQATPEARIGRLVAVDEKGHAWIDFDDGGRAIGARIELATTPAELERVMAERTPVVVRLGAEGASLVAFAGKAPARVIEADVDGRRVRLAAEQELVIACGKASITLRANGRVIIRGTHIESYSDGTNRIKGGQVRIN